MKFLLAVVLFASSFALTGCGLLKTSQSDSQPTTVLAAAPINDPQRFTSVGGSGTFALDSHTGLLCRTWDQGKAVGTPANDVSTNTPLCYAIYENETRNHGQWRWNTVEAKWDYIQKEAR